MSKSKQEQHDLNKDVRRVGDDFWTLEDTLNYSNENLLKDWAQEMR